MPQHEGNPRRHYKIAHQQRRDREIEVGGNDGCERWGLDSGRSSKSENFVPRGEHEEESRGSRPHRTVEKAEATDGPQRSLESILLLLLKKRPIAGAHRLTFIIPTNHMPRGLNFPPRIGDRDKSLSCQVPANRRSYLDT